MITSLLGLSASAAAETGSPQLPLLFMIIVVFVLAVFLGVEVISKVPTMLHTPLMSGTNAIHGIVVLGALVVFGEVEHPSLAVQIILFVAVVFGTLNVIGGFIVTDRMLGMFKGKKKAVPVKTEDLAAK